MVYVICLFHEKVIESDSFLSRQKTGMPLIQNHRRRCILILEEQGVFQEQLQLINKENISTNETDIPQGSRRGNPKTQNLFIKNCVFILTLLNFSHLQSTLHLMQYTYQDFFHCSKQFLNSSILMHFSASAIVSPLPHQQNVSL